jgi:hypothetical protein
MPIKRPKLVVKILPVFWSDGTSAGYGFHVINPDLKPRELGGMAYVL